MTKMIQQPTECFQQPISETFEGCLSIWYTCTHMFANADKEKKLIFLAPPDIASQLFRVLERYFSSLVTMLDTWEISINC